MGKMIENPRYEIVSTRLGDEDFEWLLKFTRDNNTTVSKAVEAIIQQVRRTLG
jgi:hypothetical protein